MIPDSWLNLNAKFDIPLVANFLLFRKYQGGLSKFSLCEALLPLQASKHSLMTNTLDMGS